MVSSRFLRFARFTGVLAFLIFFIVHFFTSKSRYEKTLALKKQILQETYNLNDDLPASPKTNIKIEYQQLPETGYPDKINAAFITLARNSDLEKLAPTIRSVEDRFNAKFHYDWVFINDEEFTDEFKKQVRTLCSGSVIFEKIPEEYWSLPTDPSFDKRKAHNNRMKSREKMPYGGSASYRFMCRFFSGFYYRLPAISKYDYIWRVEPETTLHCDVNYDVFKYMSDNDKRYGFTISLYEFPLTIPSLWKTVQEFITLHPKFLNDNNLMDFISFDEGLTFNLCHFWTNFEIIDVNFLKSEAYTAFFDYLDKSYGFFYERWGDAPVHSIAVALFMDKSQVHYFNDIGYFHSPMHNCPIDDEIWTKNHCMCDQKFDSTFKSFSCTGRFYDVQQLEKPLGWEKFTFTPVNGQ
ncbi:hypothetical protein WICPIJ_009817 [Wickerhamomyces pijperi]|uniref:Glycosyltransferase family 15 protein n=1 Tax=Wickerhamomyces pijperi TaxID=599730 RepID=A0A9P8TC89_WICPI|nr:hypothetical protein WICPIJ_009817 [Wickerhamomyces pijperi]